MLVYLPRSAETVMIQMVLDRRPESNIEDTLMTQRYIKLLTAHGQPAKWLLMYLE